MANEKRLIDANALQEHIGECFGYPAVDILHEIATFPTVDAVEVVHGRWEDGICSNCKEEALSTSWDEPIYDYDWEENLRYSHTETHTEHHLTNYCPNCGAKMDGDGNG
jgi:hypothetical protein